MYCLNLAHKAATKKVAHKYKVIFLFKPFDLMLKNLTCVYLGVQDTEIDLSQINTSIFFCCFPVY